ncbi:uncharacterized protein At2g34160-like [Arachis ipaensis]|uniref:uncharacterized protein At2g34160-like n=1 Tax=Arachis ipaensis TaxID=130454 RepID=UPI0007AF0509|nr:uncharacterized protein At2g34160-like [Arachis ipaensis]XP_025654041.1 uncharacterized protein At2g34160 [Arachis hypogaea]QHO11261.1 uncharacterized protein DS421_15g496600 [Arachis hypogaea]
MEVILSADAVSAENNNEANHRRNEKEEKKIVRIQVSKTKKRLDFYLNLSKRYIKQNNDVALCALGMAIPTAILISEILKRNGWATEKNLAIATVAAKVKEGRAIHKPKIEIVLGKDNEVDGSTVAETLENGAENKA